jgi:hypothetical protein
MGRQVTKPKKNPAAVTLGKLGGTAAVGKGAKVRFGKMTAEERKALAKKAAVARWGKAKGKG